MITITFVAFLILGVAVSLVDWRRGWLIALLVGVIQDPARKITPGTPVVMTFSIIVIYFAILFAAQSTLLRHLTEMRRRYTQLFVVGSLLLIFLIVAAINGLVTFGIDFWMVPALSLFIYSMPVPAVLLGYAFADSEERILSLFRFYAPMTSLMMIGTPLEYLNVKWAALGMVALPEGFIRMLPGVNIRILSGFYRAPDIMGWHAATLTMIGITMALRNKHFQQSWVWILTAGWGFFNCMLSGRRKAVYAVAVFAIVLLWRYARRLTTTQFVSLVFVGAMLAFVVTRLSQSEESSVYTKGTAVSQEEVFQRLEGGFVDTIDQFGIMGAGLGTATQGVRHFLGRDTNIGWQEGGLGKLTIELGMPGVIATILLMAVLLRLLMKISSFHDETRSSQLLRVALLGIFMANIVGFLVSAQAYSDPVITLLTAFFLGSLLATPAFEERAAAAEAAAVAAARDSRVPLTQRAPA
jgi:hypothetical protein